MDAHGPAILAEVSKEIDPKKACAAIGICPATSAFDNVCFISRIQRTIDRDNFFLISSAMTNVTVA